MFPLRPPFGRVKISGHSMEPTLVENQIVWVNYWSTPQLREVALALVENKTIVKRIKKIDKDRVWLVGDNSKDSYDSTKFGWVEKKQIIGKIMI